MELLEFLSQISWVATFLFIFHKIFFFFFYKRSWATRVFWRAFALYLKKKKNFFSEGLLGYILKVLLERYNFLKKNFFFWAHMSKFLGELLFIYIFFIFISISADLNIVRDLCYSGILWKSSSRSMDSHKFYKSAMSQIFEVATFMLWKFLFLFIFDLYFDVCRPKYCR